MKNVFLFSALIIFNGISAMERTHPFAATPITSEILFYSDQIQACKCSAHESPACKILHDYLEAYAQANQCDTTCRADFYDHEICLLAEKVRQIRKEQYIEHLKKFHNMTVNALTQCERFLDRITN